MHGIQLSFTLTGNINPALAAMFFNDLSPLIARYSPANTVKVSAPKPVPPLGADIREPVITAATTAANTASEVATVAPAMPPVDVQPSPPPLKPARVRRTQEQIAADKAAKRAAASHDTVAGPHATEAPAAVAPATVATQPDATPAPVAATPPPATAAAPTIDDVRAAYERMTKLKDARDAIKEALAACGVAQMSAVKPENYGAAIAAIDVIVAKRAA